jgi:hypothetical protein
VLLGLVLAAVYWIALTSSVFRLAWTTMAIFSAVALLWFGYANFRHTGPKSYRVFGQTAAVALCIWVVYGLAAIL